MRLAQDAMGVMPMAGGAPPPGGEGAPAPPVFKIIYSPLDTLGKILADLDFKTFLENNFGTDPEELAKKVWVMYGGEEDGIGKGKEGARQDSPQSEDMVEQTEIQEKEYNDTRDKRWLRLPLGKTIDDITDTQALTRAILGGFMALVKQNAKPAQASEIRKITRLADKADQLGYFSYSDKIMSEFINVHTPN